MEPLRLFVSSSPTLSSSPSSFCDEEAAVVAPTGAGLDFVPFCVLGRLLVKVLAGLSLLANSIPELSSPEVLARELLEEVCSDTSELDSLSLDIKDDESHDPSHKEQSLV